MEADQIFMIVFFSSVFRAKLFFFLFSLKLNPKTGLDHPTPPHHHPTTPPHPTPPQTFLRLLGTVEGLDLVYRLNSKI